MSSKEVLLEGFQVVGIKTRTSNQDEMRGVGRIQALWDQFYNEHIINMIPGKISNEVIAVYHDYEDDANAPYSLLVGVKVTSGSETPAGMDFLSIPPQKYNLFTSDKGEMPGVIFGLWQSVWRQTEKAQIARMYSFDFEVYDERASDPKSSEVDLYIATK